MGSLGERAQNRSAVNCSCAFASAFYDVANVTRAGRINRGNK
ncbi:hypothetical protein [Caudoviricetes sp.]|nr:hypothetical protein [Caudoviricetes sp.]